MRPPRTGLRRRLLPLAALGLVGLLGSGCLLSSGVHRGASLSGAMGAASSDDDEPDRDETRRARRPARFHHLRHSGAEPEDSLRAALSDSAAAFPARPSRPAWPGSQLSLRAGNLAAVGGRFDGLAGLRLGWACRIDRRDWLRLSLGFDGLPLDRDDRTFESVQDNVRAISIGVDHRRWRLNARGAPALGTLLGAEYTVLFWRYRHPVLADGWDDEGHYLGQTIVGGDLIEGLDLHGGLCLRLLRAPRFEVGLEALAGLKLWWFETYEGFDNDWFGPTPWAQLRLSVALRIE